MTAAWPKSIPGAALALFLAICMTPAVAGIEAGKRALHAGDTDTALAEFQVDARQGNPEALLQLGNMYEKGIGVPQSPDTAIVLYRVAWLQGNARAEGAVNRVANTMAGGKIVDAMQYAAHLESTGRYVPALPGAPMAGPVPPVPASKPVPAPKPVPPASAASQLEAAPAAPPVRSATAGMGRAVEFKYTCAMELKYEDKGSGGRYDMTLYQPVPEPGYYILGGYVQNNYDAPNGCALTIKPPAGAEGAVISPPTSWQRVWKDKGTGAVMDGSIWRAIPRSPDYVCLGDIGQTGKKEQPYVQNYACVNRCLVQSIRPTNPIWTTQSTGAASPIEVFTLPHTNTFIAVPEGQRPAEVLDLNPDANCL